MLGLLAETWKLLLTVVLLCSILFSVATPPPRTPMQQGELRGLVLAALGCYAAGALATLSHHGVLAAFAYAAGILACSFAVWRSRGMRRGDGPDEGDENGGGGQWPPPNGPDGLPTLDWDAFERELARFSEFQRTAR